MALFSKPIPYSELFIRLFYNNLQRNQILAGSSLMIIYLLLRLRKLENSSIYNQDLLHHRLKGPLDFSFFKRLWRISQIIAPSIRSREDSIEILLFTLVLLSRTLLTLYLADVNGKIVKALINRSFSGFLTKLFSLALCAIPASFLNSYIEYMKHRIALNVRTKLTHYTIDKYFNGLSFYDITFLAASNKPEPIQTFTQDIPCFARSFSTLLCNSIKNFFDVTLFTVKVSYDFGWKGPTSIMLWYLFSGMVLRFLSPPLGLMVSKARLLDYEFSDLVSAINENAEQLAFTRRSAAAIERQRLANTFEMISNLTRNINKRKAFLKVFDVLLHKFGTVISAYLLLGLPVFGRYKQEYLAKTLQDPALILRDLIANSFLLLNLRKSFNRFLSTLQEFFSLSGSTKFLLDGITSMQEHGESSTRIRRFFPSLKIDLYNLPNLEITEDGDLIRFKSVEIMGPPPQNQCLVTCLDLEIKPGMNTMFMGPLGCGKTAFFRVLTGLWPVKEGRLQRPRPEQIRFATSTCYFPEGSLRDQVIYPDSLAEFKKKGKRDEDLQKLLEQVGLHYLVDKVGGFQAVEAWNDFLEVGERQALQIARIMYHEPMFAILDECIWANETLMYQALKEHNITALTISHRASLSKHHGFLLRFDGEQGWSFEKFKTTKKK